MINNPWDKDAYPALHSLGHAILAFLYIAGVAWIMSNGKLLFGPEEPNNFLFPVMFLSLFVLSATITSALILGRPALLYFNGHKLESLQFLGYTVAWFAIILITLFIYLAGVK